MGGSDTEKIWKIEMWKRESDFPITVIKKIACLKMYKKRFSYSNTLKAVLYVVSRK